MGHLYPPTHYLYTQAHAYQVGHTANYPPNGWHRGDAGRLTARLPNHSRAALHSPQGHEAGAINPGLIHILQKKNHSYH